MPILGTIASSMQSGPSGPVFDSIETKTIANTTTQSVTFSSIPTSYTTLRILYYGNVTPQAGDMFIRINGDSGTNYVWHANYGVGNSSNATMLAQYPSNHLYIGYDAVVDTTTPNAIDLYLTDVQDTVKYKVGKYVSGYINSGSAFVFTGGGAWASASGITSIEFGCLNTSTKFRQNSIVSLYGIKG